MNNIFIYVITITLIFCTSDVEAAAVIKKQKERKDARQKAGQPSVTYEAQKPRQGRLFSSESTLVSFQPSSNYRDNYYNQETQEIVDITQVWKELKTSSKIWEKLEDRSPKVITVSKYIDFYKERDVIIRKSPHYYVDRIDLILKSNPALLNSPFRDVLKFVAIMDYDFDNGMDKDLMARQLLGKKAYKKNKIRLGL